MKPLLLKLAGIGPFVAPQTLDFSLMDEKALFLIHGPTGGGKSFLFDALCYALYADTPSDREGHLKSDYLEDDVEPSIEFTFALGPDSYRVRRTLRYYRPKKRGEGVTVQDDRHSLARLTGGGSETVLAEKKNDVDTRIRELMGLDAGQFRQVVMIPQGEFRKLLLADSSERENLLERLFDAGLYGEIQQHLQEHENRIRESYEAQQQAAERLRIEREGLCRSENLILPEAVDAESSETVAEATDTASDPSTPLQTRYVQLLGARIESLASAADESASLLAGALVKQEQGSALAADYARTQTLTTERQRLETRRTEMESLGARAHRDEKALNLKDRLHEARRSRQVLETAIQETEVTCNQLKLLEERRGVLEASESHIPAWREEQQQLSRRLELLVGFRGEADEQKRLKEEQAQADAHLSAVRTEQESLQLRAGELASEKAELEKALAAEAEDESHHASMARRRQILEGLVKLQTSLDANRMELESLSGECLTALGRRDVAVGYWKSLQKQKDSSLAGHLAVSLEEGKACPVCGSTQHPEPHDSSVSLPGEESLQEGEQAVRDADTKLAELEARRKSLENHLAETSRSIETDRAESGIDESGSLQRSLEELDEKEARLTRLEACRRRLYEQDFPTLQEQRRIVDVKLEGARSLLESITGNLEEHQAAWQKVCEAWKAENDSSVPVIEELDTQLSDWRESLDSLEQKLRNIETEKLCLSGELKEANAALKEKEAQQLRAREEQSSRDERLALGLVDVGIDSEEALAGFLERAGDVEDSRRRIREWESELKDTLTLLSDLEKRIAGKKMPNLETLKDECRAKRSIDEENREKLAGSRASLNRLESIGRELEALEKEGREVARRQEVMLTLSRQVRGIIPPKISLKRFFLARRLEEVLIQATRRLSVLSKGRFILRRRDEGKTAAAQAGLDLMIADSWTGTERPVNTLSGGQLFMASLSLALGLADVVQARSGGVRLEALFIDEGFGTLDDDALQGVLQVLNDLRENRMVGVISHVPELKRQIADRIEVSAAALGSSARLVTGN